MATHSSTLARKIPWTEEPGRLQSMGSLRVGHDWATSLSLFTFMHWRRQWQPTPVFLPGESQGRGSLVGCCLWGRTESDMAEVTQQQQQQQQHSIVKQLFSELPWVQFFVTSWTVAHQAPLSMEFFRQEYWSEWPFPTPRDLPNPGIEPCLPASPALAGGFFTTVPPKNPQTAIKRRKNREWLPPW